jgi:glycosyltransferase involved in cell wall biosynthesis
MTPCYMEKKPTISLCMIVKNEERLLGGCINSVIPIIDEIIIVDTGSNDKTIDVARSYGAKIFIKKWKNDFRIARNEYLKYASCDWILTLDADERIAHKDLAGIKELLCNKRISGYIFPIRNYINDNNILQEWHLSKGEYPQEEICSGWFLSESIRIFQNKKGLCYEGCVLQPDIKNSILRSYGKVTRCSIPLHHHSFLKYGNYNEIKKKQLRYLKLSLKSLRVYPKNADICFNIANILFLYKKEYGVSAMYLKKAIKLAPENLKSYWLLSMVYQRQKKFIEAKKILTKALSINRDQSSLTYTFFGDLHLKQLNLLHAVDSLKRAVKINPYNPTTHNLLGSVYEIQGKLNYASYEYKKVLMLNKKHPQARHSLIRIRNFIKANQSA